MKVTSGDTSLPGDLFRLSRYQVDPVALREALQGRKFSLGFTNRLIFE